jgi:glucose-1-phosphatase
MIRKHFLELGGAIIHSKSVGLIGFLNLKNIRLIMRNVIIFDYGGIIESHLTKSFCEWIKKKFKIKKDIWPIFKKYEILRDLGKINEHELYQNLIKELNINISEKQFYDEYFENHVKQHLDVLDFIEKELFGKYELFIFSNNSKININMLKKKINFEKFFKKCIYSYNIGIRKPDLRFFEEGLRLIEHKGEECVFIDDQLKSKENSEKTGIKFIQFINLDKLKNDLRAWNILQ